MLDEKFLERLNNTKTKDELLIFTRDYLEHEYYIENTSNDKRLEFIRRYMDKITDMLPKKKSNKEALTETTVNDWIKSNKKGGSKSI